MIAAPAMKLFNRARLAQLADALAVGVAVALPWSTSATSIFVVAWLLALIPTLDLAAIRREVMTPAGGLPVLLVALAVLGMAWADVSLAERFGGLSSFLKLLLIPLLMMQFRRSDRGLRVLAGFLVSATALLILSWILVLLPGLWWRPHQLGVPVKDYIAQSGIFILCVFALVDLAIDAWKENRRILALAFVATALLFLVNIVYIATSRTTLVVIPVLFILFGLRWFGWRGFLAFVAAGVAIATIAWTSSQYLRLRVTNLTVEISNYQVTGADTSAGSRLEFWKRSAQVVREAPVIGHGTGSIREMYRRSGSDSASNPHNQIFAVGIQVGFVGVVMLIAMWLVHWRLFVGFGLPAWIGCLVVAQNVVGSLFNSHLFDFTQGWIYVFGVGVTGGMVLRQRQAPGATDPGGCCDRVGAMRPIALSPCPRVLVIALRRLGDVLLTTPLIRSIRRAWPDATIEALVFADTAGILDGNPDIDRVIVMPAKPTTWNSVRLAVHLLKRFDLAIATQSGDRPTLFAWLAGRVHAGLVWPGSGDLVKRLLLHRSVPAGEGVHRVEEMLRLADVLGIARVPEVICPSGPLPPELTPEAPYAVIHAAPMFRYKRWTLAGWRALAGGLQERGLALVATGGAHAAERKYLDGVWSEVIGVRRLDGQLRWPEIAALLTRARVYIGPDTSVTHLAAASGCPTVALFGPTDPRLWGPWPVGGLHEGWAAADKIQRRGNVWLVQNPLHCLPCQKEGCARHVDSNSQCLDELSPRQVLDAVDQALDGIPHDRRRGPEAGVHGAGGGAAAQSPVWNDGPARL